jgi:hypothetical protein
MPDHQTPSPVRLVNWMVILWGLGIAAIPLRRFDVLPTWVWLAWGLAAVTVGLGVWGLRTRRWIVPMFAALYLLAFSLVAAAMLTDLDDYAVAGVICITVLSVGGAILHRLGQPRS